MKKLFTGILIGIVIVFGLFEGTKYAYAQYQARTIGALLPGATMSHANRYYETFIASSTTTEDSINVIVPPLQYKSYIRSVYIRKMGYTTDSDDSVIIRIYAADDNDAAGDAEAGTRALTDTVLFDEGKGDSSWTALGVSATAYADTIGPGEHLGIKQWNGRTDSTGIPDSLFYVEGRIELEIIEPR